MHQQTKKHQFMSTSKKLFHCAYSESWYTITGVGGDLQEWKDGYTRLLKLQGIGTPREFHTFTGRDYNEAFRTTGTNRYPDDILFLTFPLDGLDVAKLSMFKLQMQDRWFDDIVDNNLRREGTTYDEVMADYVLNPASEWYGNHESRRGA